MLNADLQMLEQVITVQNGAGWGKSRERAEMGYNRVGGGQTGMDRTQEGRSQWRRSNEMLIS